MSKHRFPDDDNAIMEMDCMQQLKAKWPVEAQHSGKHPELMRMTAMDREFEEKMQRVKHYIRQLES
eukprot:11509874-Karenia_brevis.AAC.1